MAEIKRTEFEEKLFGKVVEKSIEKTIEITQWNWTPSYLIPIRIVRTPISVILKNIPKTHVLVGCEGTIFDVFETNKGNYVLAEIPEFLNLDKCVKYVIIHKENFELNEDSTT